MTTLNPKDFIDLEAARKLATKAEKTSAPPKPKSGIKFYLFPEALVRTLVRTNYMPALALAAAIYRAYFKDWKNRNPVKLTSAHLAEFHISRGQKLRALKILEQSGAFSVERFGGRNSLITMTWLRIKKD
jgi:hypothetical protein